MTNFFLISFSSNVYALYAPSEWTEYAKCQCVGKLLILFTILYMFSSCFSERSEENNKNNQKNKKKLKKTKTFYYFYRFLRISFNIYCFCVVFFLVLSSLFSSLFCLCPTVIWIWNCIN